MRLVRDVAVYGWLCPSLALDYTGPPCSAPQVVSYDLAAHNLFRPMHRKGDKKIAPSLRQVVDASNIGRSTRHELWFTRETFWRYLRKFRHNAEALTAWYLSAFDNFKSALGQVYVSRSFWINSFWSFVRHINILDLIKKFGHCPICDLLPMWARCFDLDGTDLSVTKQRFPPMSKQVPPDGATVRQGWYVSSGL